jgi:hypothetical protein
MSVDVSASPQVGAGTLRSMLGEQEAVVLEVRALDVHGVVYVDVTVGFPDRTVAQARLGGESVPDALTTGERVLASTVMGQLVSLRRADEGSG